MKPRTHILAAALLLAFCTAGAAQSGSTKPSAADARPLRLTGEVLEVKLEEEKGSVKFSFKVRLKFTNEGGEPVILLSEEANEPWMGGVRLSRSREDAAGRRGFLYNQSVWPSNYRTGDPERKWERLTESLDMPFPPSDLTRVIPPGGSWDYEKDSWLYISKNPDTSSRGAGWEEIRRTSPLWLTVTFEMWPINVEPDLGHDYAFGKKLRRRWKSYGTLWLGHLESDPLELRLPEAVTKGDGR